MQLFLAGIPKVKWFGQEGDYTILVMELLGDNLETLFNYCGRQFSLKTVLMLADKMVSSGVVLFCVPVYFDTLSFVAS